MKTRQMQTAFTLMEMLVVLVIIAVVAQYLFTLTVGARERAWRARCISNMRQLVQASKMYESDYGQLPVHCPGGNIPRNFPETVWRPLIDPYVRNNDIYLCPFDDTRGWKGGAWGPPVSYMYLLTCPWLGKHGEYRPPAVSSPLFLDDFHFMQRVAEVLLIGRYDGSVETAHWSKYEELRYEPEDGLGFIE